MDYHKIRICKGNILRNSQHVRISNIPRLQYIGLVWYQFVIIKEKKGSLVR
jgi:hypothetical protein